MVHPTFFMKPTYFCSAPITEFSLWCKSCFCWTPLPPPPHTENLQSFCELPEDQLVPSVYCNCNWACLAPRGGGVDLCRPPRDAGPRQLYRQACKILLEGEGGGGLCRQPIAVQNLYRQAGEGSRGCSCPSAVVYRSLSCPE